MAFTPLLTDAPKQVKCPLGNRLTELTRFAGYARSSPSRAMLTSHRHVGVLT